MNNDKKNITLQQYFEAAHIQAETENLNIQDFLSGLGAYGILPEEVSPLVAALHTVSTKEQTVELIDALFKGVQIQPGALENQGFTQFSTSSEVQSAVPIAPTTEGRKQAYEDLGEYIQFQHKQKSDYLKENIGWRRKVAQDFITRLRNDRLYGNIDETKAKATIEKELENPIYAKTSEGAAKILAERISYDELFRENREKARKILEEAAKDRSNEIERIIDKTTIYATEAVLQHPTLEDVRPVLNNFASVSQTKEQPTKTELDAAMQKAKIFAGVVTQTQPPVKTTPESNMSFALNIQRTIQRDKEILEKRLRVDDLGQKIASSESFHDFLKRSNEDAVNRSGGKRWNQISIFSTAPDTDTLDYVEAFVRKNADVLDRPDTIMTPESYTKAMHHANNFHNIHFEFHLPNLSWITKPGAKKTGMTIAGATVKKVTAESSKALGLKILTGLGFSATSKVVLGLSSPVGWVASVFLFVLPSIGKGVGKALGGVAAGGLSPVKAASGAFSEFIQNALGTKFEDPLAANGWILALGLAVLPFLLAFLFTTATIQVQRSSFLPVGVEGGLSGDNQQQAFNISIIATPVPGPGGIPSSISYTVTITSLDGTPITINSLTITFSILGGNGQTPATRTIAGSQITGGSYTFSVPIGAAYNNSLITAVATANVDTTTQSGVDGSSTVSTVIGNPPTGCFVFGGAGQADAYGHTSSAWDDQSKVIAAIGILAASPEYLSKYVCPGGPVTLYRVKADFGGGSTSGANMIFLYNVCVSGSQACMTYTFAHETGHIVNNRASSTMSSFHNQGISNREGYLWTYPNGLTESEDYAETIGDFVVWKYYNWGSRHGHAGHLNYPQDYPLHYQFAKEMFKMEY